MKTTKTSVPNNDQTQIMAVDELIAFYRTTKYPMLESEIFELYESILKSRRLSNTPDSSL